MGNFDKGLFITYSCASVFFLHRHHKDKFQGELQKSTKEPQFSQRIFKFLNKDHIKHMREKFEKSKTSIVASLFLFTKSQA